MQIGCGTYVAEIHGRPYLYFWHYETRVGGRVQVKEYVGPADAARTRAEAARRCEGYFARAEEELRGIRQVTVAALQR